MTMRIFLRFSFTCCSKDWNSWQRKKRDHGRWRRQKRWDKAGGIVCGRANTIALCWSALAVFNRTHGIRHLTIQTLQNKLFTYGERSHHFRKRLKISTTTHVGRWTQRTTGEQICREIIRGLRKKSVCTSWRKPNMYKALDASRAKEHCGNQRTRAEVYEAGELGSGCFCWDFIGRQCLLASLEAQKVSMMGRSSKPRDWGDAVAVLTISSTGVELRVGRSWKRRSLHFYGGIPQGGGGDWHPKAARCLEVSKKASAHAGAPATQPVPPEYVLPREGAVSKKQKMFHQTSGAENGGRGRQCMLLGQGLLLPAELQIIFWK